MLVSDPQRLPRGACRPLRAGRPAKGCRCGSPGASRRAETCWCRTRAGYGNQWRLSAAHVGTGCRRVPCGTGTGGYDFARRSVQRPLNAGPCSSAAGSAQWQRLRPHAAAAEGPEQGIRPSSAPCLLPLQSRQDRSPVAFATKCVYVALRGRLRSRADALLLPGGLGRRRVPVSLVAPRFRGRGETCGQDRLVGRLQRLAVAAAGRRRREAGSPAAHERGAGSWQRRGHVAVARPAVKSAAAGRPLPREPQPAEERAAEERQAVQARQRRQVRHRRRKGAPTTSSRLDLASTATWQMAIQCELKVQLEQTHAQSPLSTSRMSKFSGESRRSLLLDRQLPGHRCGIDQVPACCIAGRRSI